MTAVVERVDGLVRLEVDGEPCVAYARLTGEVEVGDEVLVNVQAVELGLGSGGFHVLYANLTRGLALSAEGHAHVMTLPYTPLQHAVHFAEEDGGLADSLAGLPVVCCSVHGQLVPVCAALRGRRVAYVQLAGGALPVSLSDAVRTLKAARLIEVTVAAAPCFDGDVQCANVWSALASCAGFDAVVCAIGPGIVGTGSRLGHGGMAAAEAAVAARGLGASPLVAARVSHADERERHAGVSHHTRAIVEVTGATVAWPLGLDAPDWLAGRIDVEVDGWREACEGLPLSHMGRGRDDDPWFFAAAFAAGRLAAG